ncbi:MAG: 23S rRNA (pseudouridine(1915)-N(3))-methyltransferase RlmH [Methylobacteriaceae bacterium]|nr:23S rRNA (pseudouridine(1915)-N(3))-methyltransferase RlmH [Methylobacteriaceae bacterium]
MRIVLVAVGRLKPGPERELAARYVDRAKAAARSARLAGFDTREIEESAARRPEDRRLAEARAILAALPAGALVMALDERGGSMSSAAFAAEIGRQRDAGAPCLALVVGGPDGLDPSLRDQARWTLAFGAMTWPHQLARVMAAEQLYRAMTILAGHPYHRA